MKTTIKVHEVISTVKSLLPYSIYHRLKHLNDRRWDETVKELEIQKRDLELKIDCINTTINFLKRVG